MSQHPVEFIGMIGTSNLGDPRRAGRSWGGRQGLRRRHRPRPRVRRFRSRADRLLQRRRRRPRVGALAAPSTERLGLLLAPIAPASSPRRWRPASSPRRSVIGRAPGDARDHKRLRRRLGQRRRLSREGRALRPHRRLSRRAQEGLDQSARLRPRQPPYYRTRGSVAAVRCHRQPHIPVCFGGSSDEAIEVAGKHPRASMRIWVETGLRRRHHQARPAPPPPGHGRADQVRFSLSLPRRSSAKARTKPGRAPTASWIRPRRCAAPARQLRRHSAGPGAQGPRPHSPQNAGSSACLPEAAKGPVVDKRLWTKARGPDRRPGQFHLSSSARRSRSARSMLDYWDLGVTTFTIRGFDPLEDALEYGRDFPLVREATANRAAPAAAAAECSPAELRVFRFCREGGG